MADLDYNLDTLINGSLPESVSAPDVGKSTPSFQNSFKEGIDPNVIGTGEVGTQIENLGYDGKIVSVAAGDDIQKAVNYVNLYGGGTVSLLNGTHEVNYDIVLYSNVTLTGETRGSTIIDFGLTAKSILAAGSGAYTTGTVSVSNNGTTVTGSGTTWSTNAVAGQSILLGGVWYPITVVGSNTSITIALGYAGEALSGASYTIATTKKNVYVKNLTAKNSAGSAIKFQYVDNGGLENVETQTSVTGIEFDTTAQCQINQINMVASYVNMSFTNTHFLAFWSAGCIDSQVGNGVTLNTVTNSKFDSLFILNSAADGLSLTSCDKVLLNGVVSNENAGQGIEFVSGNNACVFLGGATENNTSDGVKLTATTDRCFVQTSSIKGNGGYGVNIAASTCDENLIVGNIFSTNTSGHVNDSGTSTVISGNVPDSVNPSIGKATLTAGENIAASEAVVPMLVPVSDITYDTSASAATTVASGSPLTVSFTVANQSNRKLVVFTDIEGVATAVSGVTYNGSALTELTSGVDLNWGSNIGAKSQAWVIDDPATGANDLVISSADASSRNISYFIYSFYNVDGASLVASASNTAGSPGTISLSGVPTTNAAVLVGIEHGTTTTNEVILTNVLTQSTVSAGWTGPIAPLSAKALALSSGGNAAAIVCLTPIMTSATTKAYLTSASYALRANGFLGFAEAAATAGNSVAIKVSGVVTGLSGLTVGTQYYLSNTAGAVASSAGTVTKKVGIGVATTQLLITNIW